MFDFNPNTSPCDYALRHHPNHETYLLNQAVDLFNQARLDGFITGLKNLILRRCGGLIDLTGISSSRVLSQYHGGIQTVQLKRICGTLGRTSDFDNRFHPLHDRIRDRWVNIALARRNGQALAPVELIQVGDCYFVRDGHHRLSVAHALGERAIEAEITVWNVAGSLPWETRPGAISLTWLPERNF